MFNNKIARGGIHLRIAIIGMGAAGISVLRELVTQLNNTNKYSIIIYSDEESYGTGLPYQRDDEVILLNQFTETMSLIPDDDLSFVDWLKKNKKDKDPVGKYVPRKWYGEYLQELLNDLLTQSKATVKKVPVKSIRVRDDNRYIITTTGEEDVVDFIHLTTGHLAYQDPYDLKGIENYLHHPYPLIEKVKDLSHDPHVAILGTGLTSIDIMIYLRKINPMMRISFLSLDGKFSSVRGPTRKIDLYYLTQKRLCEEKEKSAGIIPFATIKNWFIKEVEHQGLVIDELWGDYGHGTVDGLRFDLDHLDKLGKFQSIIISMKDLYPEIWRSLSEKGREKFLADYEARFLSFRSPIPVSSAEKIIESVDKGYVNIYKDITEIIKEKKGFQIKFDSTQPCLEVDYVFNGTGQTSDLSEKWDVQAPLIQQLLNERILSPYSHGGVQIIYPDMSVISQRFGTLPSFKVYGQLVSGIDYFNNTVDLISKSAVNGVRSMIDWEESRK